MGGGRQVTRGKGSIDVADCNSSSRSLRLIPTLITSTSQAVVIPRGAYQYMLMIDSQCHTGEAGVPFLNGMDRLGSSTQVQTAMKGM